MKEVGKLLSRWRAMTWWCLWYCNWISHTFRVIKVSGISCSIPRKKAFLFYIKKHCSETSCLCKCPQKSYGCGKIPSRPTLHKRTTISHMKMTALEFLSFIVVLFPTVSYIIFSAIQQRASYKIITCIYYY